MKCSTLHTAKKHAEALATPSQRKEPYGVSNDRSL
jgi:hypothetical protein